MTHQVNLPPNLPPNLAPNPAINLQPTLTIATTAKVKKREKANQNPNVQKQHKKKNTKSKGATNSARDIASENLLSEGGDLDMDNTPQGPNDNIRSGSNETVASTFMAQYNRPNLDLGFEFELSIFV